jgi:hypothetical protein
LLTTAHPLTRGRHALADYPQRVHYEWPFLDLTVAPFELGVYVRPTNNWKRRTRKSYQHENCSQYGVRRVNNRNCCNTRVRLHEPTGSGWGGRQSIRWRAARAKPWRPRSNSWRWTTRTSDRLWRLLADKAAPQNRRLIFHNSHRSSQNHNTEHASAIESRVDPQREYRGFCAGPEHCHRCGLYCCGASGDPPAPHHPGRMNKKAVPARACGELGHKVPSRAAPPKSSESPMNGFQFEFSSR